MKKILILIVTLVSLIFTLTLLGCERDDICAEAVATTPRLIIRFYDINNPDNLKQVRQLEAEGLKDGSDESNGIIIPRANTDSINLPLNFESEIETFTRFRLTKDADFANDTNADGEDNEDTVSNPDVITIKYTPEFIYVSRACGYKSIFNLDEIEGISREVDEDIWITSFEIVNQTIDNENAAQIIIYH